MIGCGNPARCDDGVGSFVVRAVGEDPRRLAWPDMRILDAGTDGMSVMFKARGVERLVVIDAMRSRGAPGTIYQVPGEKVCASYEPSLNLHDFRWEHALFAGRKMFGAAFPSDITVYLVEAGSLGFGLDLTPAVRSAALRVVDKILDRLTRPAPQTSGALC